jgi:hypothetical protein
VIRHERKRWVYECTLCEVTIEAPDQLRIVEAQNSHERGIGTHWANRVRVALGPFVREINRIAGQLAPVIDQFEQLNAPAPNIPHDPSLLRDKRKWGGR